MTDLMPAFNTLEFYAGLMTGALVWRAVQTVARQTIERVLGSSSSSG